MSFLEITHTLHLGAHKSALDAACVCREFGFIGSMVGCCCFRIKGAAPSGVYSSIGSAVAVRQAHKTCVSEPL